jgi:glyoxalase family protein
VATNPPGFQIDEDPSHLGEALQLPPWVEHARKDIEENLQVIKVQAEKFMD